MDHRITQIYTHIEINPNKLNEIIPKTVFVLFDNVFGDLK